MARTKSDFRKSCENGTKKQGNKSKKTASSSTDLVAGEASENGNVRLRPGMRSLQQIREYQASTELLLRKTSFQKLVREIAMKMGTCRFEVQALLALQEAAEMFMVGLCEDASMLAGHGRRVTLMPRDVQMARRLRSALPGAKAYKSEAAVKKADNSTKASSSVVAQPGVEGAPDAEMTDFAPLKDGIAPTDGVTKDTDAAPTAEDDDDDEEDDEDYEEGDAAESDDEELDDEEEANDIVAETSDIPILAAL